MFESYSDNQNSQSSDLMKYKTSLNLNLIADQSQANLINVLINSSLFAQPSSAEGAQIC